MTSPMNLEEVMTILESEGTEQAQKIYRRHGAAGPVFGVSFAVINKLAKKIKINHDLALELWATGNHDARQLAAKIVDPAAMTLTSARSWIKGASDYMTVGAVAGVVAASPHARRLSEEWRGKRDEWVASAGWLIVAFSAENPEVFTAAELNDLLSQIEAEIHDRPNRVRHEMNQCLITIALRSKSLQKRAVATARRIGPVVVDHGETGCKTPEAVGYIEKTVAHRERKLAAG